MRKRKHDGTKRIEGANETEPQPQPAAPAVQSSRGESLPQNNDPSHLKRDNKKRPAPNRAKIRKKSRKNKKQQPSSPPEALTELTAVGHILADEVHKYLHSTENREEISQGEKRQLLTWVDAVQKRIHHQSLVITENVNLVADLRKALGSVDSLRDDLVVLRTQTRHIQSEIDSISQQSGQSKEESTARQGASKFLNALEQLAAATNESSKEGAV